MLPCKRSHFPSVHRVYAEEHPPCSKHQSISREFSSSSVVPHPSLHTQPHLPTHLLVLSLRPCCPSDKRQVNSAMPPHVPEPPPARPLSKQQKRMFEALAQDPEMIDYYRSSGPSRPFKMSSPSAKKQACSRALGHKVIAEDPPHRHETDQFTG